MRALDSHQCGPGSIPGLGVICGLSSLLVLVLAPRGFPPGTPVFPSPQKTTFPNSNSTWTLRATGLIVLTDCCVALVKQSWFIDFIYLVFKFKIVKQQKQQILTVLALWRNDFRSLVLPGSSTLAVDHQTHNKNNIGSGTPHGYTNGPTHRPHGFLYRGIRRVI